LACTSFQVGLLKHDHMLLVTSASDAISACVFFFRNVFRKQTKAAPKQPQAGLQKLLAIGSDVLPAAVTLYKVVATQSPYMERGFEEASLMELCLRIVEALAFDWPPVSRKKTLLHGHLKRSCAAPVPVQSHFFSCTLSSHLLELNLS